MFDQVLVIGCGLIGSSILRCLNRNKIVKKLIACDNEQYVCDYIKKLSICNEVVSNPNDAVKNSDLVIVSTPLSSFEHVVNSSCSEHVRQTYLSLGLWEGSSGGQILPTCFSKA